MFFLIILNSTTEEQYTGIVRFVKNNIASVLFKESKSVSFIKDKYKKASRKGEKVKILIVPGHEPQFGGTEYGDAIERDMAVVIGENLKSFLKQNKNFDVQITRDFMNWNPELNKYIVDNWEEIKKWKQQKKDEVAVNISNGALERRQEVVHNKALDAVALRLFGINKWANDKDFDIIIHIHLNDAPRSAHSPSKYSGFAVYIPDSQYSNAKASRALGEIFWKRLSLWFSPSDLGLEGGGLIEDQDLIAIGASNTVDGASVLVEYGYIYEPQFQSKDIRTAILKELAYQTYLGIEDFFIESKSDDKNSILKTSIVPYFWSKELDLGSKGSDVLSLQYALSVKDHYPPKERTLRNCPLSGFFGECTKDALIDFQKNYLNDEDFVNESGKLGEKTREKLNVLF